MNENNKFDDNLSNMYNDEIIKYVSRYFFKWALYDELQEYFNKNEEIDNNEWEYYDNLCHTVHWDGLYTNRLSKLSCDIERAKRMNENDLDKAALERLCKNVIITSIRCAGDVLKVWKRDNLGEDDTDIVWLTEKIYVFERSLDFYLDLKRLYKKEKYGYSPLFDALEMLDNIKHNICNIVEHEFMVEDLRSQMQDFELLCKRIGTALDYGWEKWW